uniref:Chromosome 9 open reading frame 43 n=1 Tax=Panthera tigris altaica TaxID=74533 RepID=A0A8C9K7L7_PANTA
MDLPDESQWDETTCKLAVCQHPQCWATIRRVERGHPRILGPPCKTALNNEDESPVLTIVNISDSCFRAKRLAHGFTFTKAPSLLCQGSKFDSKFQGRPRKDLPDKDFTHYTDRSPKLSVLDLNETRLPSSQDVRNMVVVWIPEQPEKRKDHFLYRKQKTETQLGPPGMNVPPPLPVHSFEQLTSESIPFWNQFDLEPLPQDLLKNLLPDEGKTRPSLEMKTQLAMMKKKLALEKSRPDSAISAKMFLSVHRLALQRPALRYPEHLKKLCSNLNTEGHKQQQQQQQKQQQQQRLVKTPPKRQEAKKKPKSDPGSPNILHKRSGAMVYGHRTLLGCKSDQKQPQWMKLEGLTLKQVRVWEPFCWGPVSVIYSYPELSKTKPSNKDISTQEDAVLESQERSPEDLSDGTSRTRWNPELKLLRILQATDDEDEEN